MQPMNPDQQLNYLRTASPQAAAAYEAARRQNESTEAIPQPSLLGRLGGVASVAYSASPTAMRASSSLV